MQNSDCRFWSQIRSHFLLHQEANHHRYLEGDSFFRTPHNWHTNSDTSWDIPSFCYPSICKPLGTLLGTSHLFCCPSIGTQIMTFFGISQHFRPYHNGILLFTSNPFAIVLQRKKSTFALLLIVPFYWTVNLIQ